MSVYFITARKTGLVKIGTARDPARRLSSLRTSSPVELKLEAIIPGSADDERELHRRFRRQRVRGEWFRISKEIEEIIRGAPIGTDGAVEPQPRPHHRSLEEIIEEQIACERQAYADCMAWRERHDPKRALDLDPPKREAA